MFVVHFIDYMIELDFVLYVFGAMAFCGIMYCLQLLILKKRN